MSMKLKLFTIAALSGLVSCTDMEAPAPEGPADEVDAVTDSMKPLPAVQAPGGDGRGGTASLVGTGPIAYGAIQADGTKFSGTSNWTSTYNASLQRYEIAITGESYFYLSYATVVTPAGDVRFCRTDSVSGKLLVYCYDQAGTPASSRIGFVTSRP